MIPSFLRPWGAVEQTLLLLLLWRHYSMPYTPSRTLHSSSNFSFSRFLETNVFLLASDILFSTVKQIRDGQYTLYKKSLCVRDIAITTRAGCEEPQKLGQVWLYMFQWMSVRFLDGVGLQTSLTVRDHILPVLSLQDQKTASCTCSLGRKLMETTYSKTSPWGWWNNTA